MWTTEDIMALYKMPLMDLVYKAATIHRENHDPNKIQISSLISIKTGGCPEDCSYCPQSAHHTSNISGNDLMSVDQVRKMAEEARAKGSSRVCLGAAWRNVRDGDEFEQVLEMVRTITKMDMEVCCTLGMITENQAKRLEEAGLYAYNHNLDSSEDYYEEIISTRAYKDRLDTINNVRKTSITVCSGGIIGMGETLEHRAGLLETLSKITPPPESVPINALVAVEGTPMENQEKVSIFDMVRMIATTRIVLPQTQVRLSAGRNEMSQEGQALCFLAGANSIFAGDKLLTTPNPKEDQDKKLFDNLGIIPQMPFEKHEKREVVEAVNSIIPPLNEKPKWSRPAIKK